MPRRQVIISYIPALHQGYIKFFDNYPEATIYVLSEKYVKEMPRMDRDIRALSAGVIQKMLQAARKQDVKLLSSEELKKLIADKNLKIILPDEELNRNFAKKYLSDKDVKFVPAFLRWDKQMVTAELEIPPHRIVSEKERDREIMGQAFEESEKSPDWWRQIGAIITKENKILLVGHNRPFPSEDYSLNVFGDPRSNFDAGEFIELSKFIHGEANLIAQAAKKGIKLEGASIYVTTFPCPVCAKLIATAGFKRVYYSKGYSLLDAEDIFQAHGIEIILVKT
jgi:dCMP deaminase